MATPYQFQCDYIAGCTPQIMNALLRHNLTEVPGYCEDMFCKEAEAKICEACKCPDAGVFFFAGGTICNLSLICLLYTSPSPRDISGSRMPSSA